MKRYLYLSFFCLLLSSIATAQRIHAIIFADTNDASIGSGVQVNRNNMKLFINEVAAGLGMSEALEPIKIYDGYNCNNSNLKQVMKNFSCSSQDIVIFCYFGHGGRSYNDPSEFPQMCLGSSNESDFVPLEDVRDLLVKHGPRFCLVLGDCCNSYASSITKKRDVFNAAGNTNISLGEVEELRKLFFGFNGAIIGAGCKKGEYSWINSQYGGFFTGGFFYEFGNSLKSGNADWNTMFVNIRKSVVDLSKRAPGVGDKGYVQTPIFRIDPKSDSDDGKNDRRDDDRKKKDDNPKPKIKDGVRTALIGLADDSRSATTRINAVSDVKNRYFTSNARVITLGRDLETQIREESISDYLDRISTAFRLKNFSIIEQKESGGKISYLKIHEIYVGK